MINDLLKNETSFNEFEIPKTNEWDICRYFSFSKPYVNMSKNIVFAWSLVMTSGEFNTSDHGHYFPASPEFLDGENTFTIFVGFMILQLFFVLKMMSERKANS